MSRSGYVSITLGATWSAANGLQAELWWHEDREDLEDICEHINALWHRDHEDEQSGEDRAVEKACYELLSRDELPDYHRIFLSIRIASYADTLDKKLEYYESGLHWVAVLQGKLEGVGARDERVTKMKMMLTRSREGVLQEKSELQQGAPDDPDNAAPAPTGPPILIKANEIDLLTYG